MNLEIERKFLVSAHKIDFLSNGKIIRQCYITSDNQFELRIRIEGNQAFLTTKTRKSQLTRYETEKEIDFHLASKIVDVFPSDEVIEKIRYDVKFAGKTWTIDRFHGSNDGLVLAEIELENEEEAIELPGWICREVTQDERYTNAHLAKKPYLKWSCRDSCKHLHGKSEDPSNTHN